MKRDAFLDFVLDQLQPLPGLRCRAMFGGFGLYQEDIFFAILHRGRLFLKTDINTRSDFTSREMGPFRPSEKQTLKNYFEVPLEIIETRVLLIEWAEKSVAVAMK